MLKFLISFLMVFQSALAGDSILKIEDFQSDNSFKQEKLVSVERVFVDELVGQDLYKVSMQMTALEGGASVDIVVCEYALVIHSTQGKNPLIERDGQPCSMDIEAVLGGSLIDEL